MGLFGIHPVIRMTNSETSEKKMTRVRIGFALLCGLAVCCSVMYITADAGEEYIHEVIKGHNAAPLWAALTSLRPGRSTLRPLTAACA